MGKFYPQCKFCLSTSFPPADPANPAGRCSFCADYETQLVGGRSRDGAEKYLVKLSKKGGQDDRNKRRV